MNQQRSVIFGSCVLNNHLDQYYFLNFLRILNSVVGVCIPGAVIDDLLVSDTLLRRWLVIFLIFLRILKESWSRVIFLTFLRVLQKDDHAIFQFF